MQPGLNSQDYFREERGLEGIRVSSVWFWACDGPQVCCRAFWVPQLTHLNVE